MQLNCSGLAEEERLKMEALEKKLAEEEAERQRILAEKRRIEEEKRRAEEAKRLEEEQPLVDDRYEQMKTKPKIAARLREEQDLVSGPFNFAYDCADQVHEHQPAS